MSWRRPALTWGNPVKLRPDWLQPSRLKDLWTRMRTTSVRDAWSRLRSAGVRDVWARLRSLHWKDVTIVALGVAVLALAAVALKGRLPFSSLFQTRPDHEAVRVFDVVVDRESWRSIDLLFDRAIEGVRVGEIPGRPPAEISPEVGGAWVWRDANVLRFESSGRLPMATEFAITLKPRRLAGERQRLEGPHQFKVRTDQFLVERVDVSEEPALEGQRKVIFRGTLRFNYRVDPKVLIPRIRLIDPLRGESDPIEVKLETAWAGRALGFQTAPVQKHKEDRTLRLVLSGDLTPVEGNVPLNGDFVQEIPLGSSEKLAVRGFEVAAGEKESTLQVKFSSPVSASVAAGHIRLAPDVKFRLNASGGTLILTGPFRPGETYEIRLAKGFPAADDAVLQQEWQSRFSIPNLEDEADFESDGMFLSRSGYRRVAIRTVNVSRVSLAIDRVFLNNLFFLFQYYGYAVSSDEGYSQRISRSLGDRIAEEELEVRGERNLRHSTPVDLERFIKKDEPGLYRLVVTRPGEWRSSQRLLLLTDLGIVTKSWGDGVLVWVSSFTDLSPVPDARVRLISDQNQLLAEGRTDGSGLWEAAGLRDKFKKGRPYLITVERGSDFSFLLFDRMRIDSTGLEVSGAPARASGYSAYLYGERDLYRPGEVAKGVVVLRDDGLQPPPPMPAILRHRDPQGRERDTLRVSTDRRGLAEFLMEVPAYSLTGRHTLEFLVAEEVVGRYGFQVEEFVPDRIKVEIAPATAAVSAGQELAYEVAGTYLFGPPAGGLHVESRVRIEDADFKAPGYEPFSFRNPDRTLSAQEILKEQSTLQPDGHRRFSVSVPRGAPVPSSLEAVIVARVSEHGGRGVTALRRLRVHPYPYYLGLRREGREYPEPGTEATFEYVALSPEGKERPSGPLRAELFQDRWNTVLRRTAAGNYAYESSRESVLIGSLTIAAGKSRDRFGVNVPEQGAYRLTLTDPDTSASAEVGFYAAGWGYSPWAIKNPARVELELEQEEYQPGQTATLLVKAPFPGRLLVTVERERVYDRQIHTLRENTARIQIPIRAEYRPNAYVTATLVRPVKELQAGSVGRAFGAAPLNVDRISNRLAVDISAPEVTRGGSKLRARISTAPGTAVTVSAVDEGILQLVSQKTADPFAHFYQKLALGTSAADTFAQLLPEVPPATTPPAGGDEGAEGLAQYVRTEGMRRVKPVALWSGIVEADGRGEAAVSFDLPEFQGGLRLMAVVAQGRKFGSAERMVRVRDPIVVTPTFPRFLSFEEDVEIPVTVRNDTGRPGMFQVEMQASGPVSLQGQHSRSLSLANGTESTLYFPVRTGKEAGEAGLVATASGNGETARSGENLPIRADLPPRAVEAAGSIQEGRTALAADDTGWARPGSLRRTLRIGPTPLVQLSGKLDHLLHYPYGCLEQVVSSAFPLLYLEDLARQLEPDLFDKNRNRPTPAQAVQEGIRRVGSLHLHSGGFSLWPGGEEAHEWASIYAAHFLIEARRAGYEVSDFLHESVLDYLAAQARSKEAYGSDELQRYVYALFLLARADREDLGTMDFLRAKHLDKMGSESRALLAAAYAHTGNDDAVNQLASQIREIDAVARQTGRNFNSTIRNRALLLLALVEARSDDPRLPSLADRLAREIGRGEIWSTQESSFALLALGQFFRKQAARPAYSGAAYAGTRRLGTFGTEAVTFGGITGSDPVRIEMNAGYQPGSAYFNLLTRGIPTDEAFRPESAGLEVKHELLNRDGGSLDPQGVRQGDLIVIRTQIRSIAGPLQNVVIQSLLPSGLEVENPRLETTESLPWVPASGLSGAYLDLRDDRILIFTDLAADRWEVAHALARAVTPGRFRLPPVQAEAMYDPALRVTGSRGEMRVGTRESGAP